MISDFMAGTTKIFTVAFTLNGTPADLSLDTVKFLLRSKKSAAVVLSVDASLVNPNQVRFTLSNTDTNLTPGLYDWQVEWTRNTGEKYVPLYGEVTIYDHYVLVQGD